MPAPDVADPRLVTGPVAPGFAIDRRPAGGIDLRPLRGARAAVRPLHREPSPRRPARRPPASRSSAGPRPTSTRRRRRASRPATWPKRSRARRRRSPRLRHPGRVVLCADTTVVLDGGLLEKPVDAADARRMLRLLSGREHEVVTGVAVARDGRLLSGRDVAPGPVPAARRGRDRRLRRQRRPDREGGSLRDPGRGLGLPRAARRRCRYRGGPPRAAGPGARAAGGRGRRSEVAVRKSTLVAMAIIAVVSAC